MFTALLWMLGGMMSRTQDFERLSLGLTAVR
jgi:hypothetical protein